MIDKYDFDIEESEIGPNCRNAKVYYDGRRAFPVEASVMTYENYITADYHRGQMKQCGNTSKGTYVARQLFVAVCPKTNKGLLFVDRLYRSPPKPEMWRELKGKVVGFSDFYKKRYQQILHGLYCMHSLNIPHGNLPRGVLYAKDGSVRLYNFQKPNNETLPNGVEEKRFDFEGVRQLILANLRERPIPNAKLHRPEFNMPHEIKYYCDLLDDWPHDVDYKFHLKWLYQAPMCWSSQVKLIFLEAIHQIMRKSPQSLKNFQLSDHFVAYWWRTRLQNQPASFENVFYFPTDPKSSSRKHDPRYNNPNGVLFFARNFKHHFDFRLATVIDVLEGVFPELLSAVYLDLVKKPFKNDVLWELSETNASTTTTVKEYLFRNPSLFHLHQD